jgi:hypothetical protein
VATTDRLRHTSWSRFNKEDSNKILSCERGSDGSRTEKRDNSLFLDCACPATRSFYACLPLPHRPRRHRCRRCRRRPICQACHTVVVVIIVVVVTIAVVIVAQLARLLLPLESDIMPPLRLSSSSLTSPWNRTSCRPCHYLHSC